MDTLLSNVIEYTFRTIGTIGSGIEPSSVILGQITFDYTLYCWGRQIETGGQIEMIAS